MKDEIEIYWRMYIENCTQGRHHETMRATLTTIIVAITAASLGLLKVDPPSCSQLPLPALVIVLGVFGAIVTRKHYERFALHMRRASAYRRKIDALLPGLDLTSLKRGADEKQKLAFPRFYYLSLAWLWASVHFAVVLVGLAAGALIAVRAGCV